MGYNRIKLNLKKNFYALVLSASCLYAHAQNYTTSQLKELEQSFDGRIGIYAINTANNETVSYRANERFALCSTAKLIVVAATLKKSETQPNSNYLERILKYNQQDLAQSNYAPVTSNHLASGMNIKDLSEAAITYSDNLAMNLLVKDLGGPQVITQYARSIQDKKFRLDRIEPGFGSAIPGDPRDTTTPKNMANSLQKIILKNVLNNSNKDLLFTWMKNNKTGFTRIRAGVPKGWVIADKTGKGDYGTNNDIAVIYPPNSSPIILAIYTTQKTQDAKSNDGIIVNATKIVLETLLADDYSDTL